MDSSILKPCQNLQIRILNNCPYILFSLNLNITENDDYIHLREYIAGEYPILGYI